MTKALTKKQPVERNMSLDPTTLSVVWHRIDSILDEVGEKILHAAQSFVMANARDLGCALADADGRLVAVAAFMASHALVAGDAIQSILTRFRDDLHPGDYIIGNDPYILRTGHLPDWSFIRPVFYKDELFGLVQARGHVADTGGFLPGGYGPGAYDIIAEGLNIPPLRVIEKGVLNKELWTFLLRNVRNPAQVEMDAMLINGALVQAEERIVALIERYGFPTVRSCIDEMIGAAERTTRAEIAKMPDGVYYGESAGDWDGQTDKPIWVRVEVTIKGDEITFDFSKSDPQQTFVNMPTGSVHARTMIAFYLVVGPSLPKNHGTGIPVHIISREGTVCNPRYPATVGASALTVGNELIEACIMALAKAVPEQAVAGFSKHWCPISIGMDRRIIDPRTGNVKQYFAETFGSDGSAGATKGYDGWQGIGCYCWVGQIARADIEIFESAVPYRVLRYEILQDWEGAGEFRGGPGVYFELAADTVTDDPAILMAGNCDGEVFAPIGVAGGGSPPTVQAWIDSPDGKRRRMRTFVNERILPGEVCCSKVSGGGGWGSPFNRDALRVQEDVVEGLVSRQRARDVYGVVFNPETLEVDRPATEKLRAEMKSKAT